MFTESEAATLGEAWRILQAHGDASRHSNVIHVGYVAGKAETAGEAVFDVLNCAHAYLDDRHAGRELDRGNEPAGTTSAVTT